MRWWSQPPTYAVISFANLPLDKLVAVTAAARPGAVTTPSAVSKLALRSLAMRHQGLTAELVVLDRELGRLTMGAAPALCELAGVGPDVAGAPLVAAGDNPERLRSDATTSAQIVRTATHFSRTRRFVPNWTIET